MHFSSKGLNPAHYELSGSQEAAEGPLSVLRLFPLFVVLVLSLILLEAGVKYFVYVLSFTPEMIVYAGKKSITNIFVALSVWKKV